MKKSKIKNKELKKLIKDIKTVASLFHSRGWAESNAGNLSVNVTSIIEQDDADFSYETETRPLGRKYPSLAGKYFIMSGSGIRFREIADKFLSNSVLMKISEDGDGYHYMRNNGAPFSRIRPTSELPTHLAIHEFINNEGRGEKVVFHTHVNELIALTHSKEYLAQGKLTSLLFAMHPEVSINVPKGVGILPYMLPGTMEIAEATVNLLKNHNLILWEKHGIFAIGDSPCECFDKIDIISKAARIYLLCKMYGFEPEGISEGNIRELKDFFGI
jgi:rhamnulose-1-phosphate aldolase